MNLFKENFMATADQPEKKSGISIYRECLVAEGIRVTEEDKRSACERALDDHVVVALCGDALPLRRKMIKVTVAKPANDCTELAGFERSGIESFEWHYLNAPAADKASPGDNGWFTGCVRFCVVTRIIPSGLAPLRMKRDD